MYTMNTGLHNEKLATLSEEMSDEDEKHTDYELIVIESDETEFLFCSIHDHNDDKNKLL